MKWTTAILSLAFAATSVQAAPAPAQDSVFILKVSTSVNPDLDGRYIGMNGELVGIFDDEDIAALRVQQVASTNAGCKKCSELHIFPVGIVDHALGLVGAPGFMQLADVMNPDGFKPAEGQAYSYDTFQTKQNKLSIAAEGQWLAFPLADNNWRVMWSDGSVMTIQNYVPIEITLEAAGTPRQ